MSALRWTVGARLTAQVVTWAITLIVIRILSPADYGLLAMATVFIGFLAMFSEFGLGSAIVQRPDIDVPTLAPDVRGHRRDPFRCWRASCWLPRR